MTLWLVAVGVLAAEDQPLVSPAVIVTGTKTTAEIGQVPASVAVVTSQQLDDHGDRTIDDVVGQIANVHVINLGGHFCLPVIRGISGLSDQTPASLVIDGINPRGLGMDGILDAAQVEVLRGPQGTLYGHNTIPGVIAITTREPGLHWNGWGQVEAGSYRTASAAAAAGGPLSDTLGLRVAVRGSRSDGTRTNITTNDDRAAASTYTQGQGKLVWAVGDGWKVQLTGMAVRDRTTGDQFAPLDLAARHETQNSEAGEFSAEVAAGGLTISRTTDERTLTAITGASRTHDVFDLDIDFTPTPGSTLHKETVRRQLSQEVRYSGGSGLRSWLVGLYAGGERQAVDAPMVLAPNPQLPPGLQVARGGEQTDSDLAAFGQAGLPLGPGWTLTLGLRLDYDRQAVEYTYRDNLTPGFDYSGSRSDTAALPKAALSYAWSDDALTWLSVAEGSTPGGYNLTPASLTEIEGGYDPETAWSYEFGQRIAALDRRLRWSFAASLTDYRDKQVTVLLPPTTYLIRNAARARITAIETDLAAEVASGVDVLAGIGALKPLFTDYDSGAGDLSGNHLPMAPSYDGYLGLQWRAECGLFVRGDLTAIGSYYADDQNTIEQDAYRQLGARIGYETADWSLSVWGRNLNDAVYWTRGSVSQSGQKVAVSGDPRTVGVTGDVRF